MHDNISLNNCGLYLPLGSVITSILCRKHQRRRIMFICYHRRLNPWNDSTLRSIHPSIFPVTDNRTREKKKKEKRIGKMRWWIHPFALQSNVGRKKDSSTFRKYIRIDSFEKGTQNALLDVQGRCRSRQRIIIMSFHHHVVLLSLNLLGLFYLSGTCRCQRKEGMQLAI